MRSGSAWTGMAWQRGGSDERPPIAYSASERSVILNMIDQCIWFKGYHKQKLSVFLETLSSVTTRNHASWYFTWMVIEKGLYNQLIHCTWKLKLNYMYSIAPSWLIFKPIESVNWAQDMNYVNYMYCRWGIQSERFLFSIHKCRPITCIHRTVQ